MKQTKLHLWYLYFKLNRYDQHSQQSFNVKSNNPLHNVYFLRKQFTGKRNTGDTHGNEDFCWKDVYETQEEKKRLKYKIGLNAPLIGLNAPLILLIGMNAPLIGLNAPLIGLNAPLIGMNAPLIGLNARHSGLFCILSINNVH